MLTTSPPMIFKNEFSKLVSLMARHLTTNEFQIHVHQRESVWMCSPPRHQWFFMNDISKLVSEMARHLATKDFQDWFVKACIRTGSPPRHQWFFMDDISKLVSEMARHLATRKFWIHSLQREPAWICSPPRHQGFSRLICQSVYQNWLATSPPLTFWFIWFKERLFEYARHLATNDF